MPSSILDMLQGVESAQKEYVSKVRLGAHLNHNITRGSGGNGSGSKRKTPKHSQRYQHSIGSYFQNKANYQQAVDAAATPSEDDLKCFSWSCATCTYYMDNSPSSSCQMCGSQRPKSLTSRHLQATSSSSAHSFASTSSFPSSSSSPKKRRRVIADDDESDCDNNEENDEDLLYAKKLQEAELLNRKYLCGICLDDDVKLEDMVSLSCQPVAHKYCKECFIDYCSSKINERITEIYCPEIKCKCEITFWELEGNLPAEVMKKYERFSIRNVCERNGYIHCPRCNEWFADVNLADTPQAEAVWKKVRCGKCSHEFCGKCGEAPHKGVSLQQDITCADLARELSNINNDSLMLELASDKGYKKCPCCHALTELVEDCCKFVYCRCGKKFCFLCEIELTDKDHYNHFRGKPGWYIYIKLLIFFPCLYIHRMRSALLIFYSTLFCVHSVGPFGPVCVNTSTGEATQYSLRRSTKENMINYQMK